MNTTDFIRQLAAQLNISQKQAKRLLQQELSAIGDQLAEGNDVVIRGFGKFSLRDAKTAGKQPAASKNVVFKAARKFRDRVRNWRPE